MADETTVVEQLLATGWTFVYLAAAAALSGGVLWLSNTLGRRADRREAEQRAAPPPEKRLATLAELADQRQAAEENLRWPHH